MCSCHLFFVLRQFFSYDGIDSLFVYAFRFCESFLRRIEINEKINRHKFNEELKKSEDRIGERRGVGRKAIAGAERRSKERTGGQAGAEKQKNNKREAGRGSMKRVNVEAGTGNEKSTPFRSLLGEFIFELWKNFLNRTAPFLYYRQSYCHF